MNSPRVRKETLWLRTGGLILGIGILVWLPFEERSELGVLLISGAICTWSAFWILRVRVESEKQLLLRHGVIGAGAGLLIVPVALLLMALKTGLHGHGTPDFTVGQMQLVLSRVPYFIISGFLVGVGSGLWRVTMRGPSKEGGKA